MLLIYISYGKQSSILESKPKSLHTGYGILAGIEMCLVRNRAEKELCED